MWRFAWGIGFDGRRPKGEYIENTLAGLEKLLVMVTRLARRGVALNLAETSGVRENASRRTLRETNAAGVPIRGGVLGTNERKGSYA